MRIAFLLSKVKITPSQNFCLGGRLASAAVYLGLQNAHIGKIAVFFIVIQAIAYDKGIGHLGSHICRIHFGLTPLRLIKEGAEIRMLRGPLDCKISIM